jgi:transcription initiation factor TFIIE subunit alpha
MFASFFFPFTWHAVSQIDQLFNFETQELRCTFCNGEVTESSRGSGGGGRMTLQKFNEQTEQLFDLLKKVEGVRLSAELLAPEPTDVSALTGYLQKCSNYVCR